MDTPMQVIIVNNPDTNENITLNFHHIKKTAVILRAINHRFRQQLIHMLDEHHKMTVTQIFSLLRMEQSIVSQHLATLRRAQIVHTQKEGKFVFYSINYKRLKEINNFVEQLVG